MTATDVLAAAASALARGERAALVTIVRASGSTPQRVGAKMIVFADGRTVGTIGGGCYENDAAQRARGGIEAGRPELVRYDLNDDVVEESGLICGGQMDVFIEPLIGPPDLYVVGAGHVGTQVARLAQDVGFRVHVVDDREKFANRERLPHAHEVAVGAIADWLNAADIPASAFVVIVTRGHRYDLDAMRELVGRDLRYLGMIGSRAKVARLYEQLSSEGVAPERLARVHAPVGLDIGAVTPEEIAVSIVAELIAVRYGRIGSADQGAVVAARPKKWSPAVARP